MLDNNNPQKTLDSGFIYYLKKIIRNRTIYGIIMVFLLWYIFHYGLQSAVIPAPHRTVCYFFSNFIDIVAVHLLTSLARILVAVFISL
ncbi:MAG: hypothetical protein ACOC1N_06165, partial [Bacillota bacterium]